MCIDHVIRVKYVNLASKTRGVYFDFSKVSHLWHTFAQSRARVGTSRRGRWCTSGSELAISAFIIWLRQPTALEHRLYGDVYIRVHNYVLSHYIIDTLRLFLETNIGEMHWYSYITKPDLCLLLWDSRWQPLVSGEWRVHYFLYISTVL